MLTALHESFWDRLTGVVTLQRPAYDALRVDPAATGQAWLIVVFLGLANGIAMVATPVATFFPDASAELTLFLTFDTAERQMLGLALGVIGAVVGWYLAAWLLRLIGNRMAAGRTVTPEEMRRLVGWGYVPSLAAFLAPIPLVGPLLAALGSLWAFVTGVMAVRAAFDVGIGKALAIGVVAFLIATVVVVAIVLVTVMLVWPLA
jgi:hypothetical protein